MKVKTTNVVKVPNLRFSEFEGKWRIIELGKLGEIITGLTYNPNQINEKGILVLRSSNVKNRNLSFNDNVFVKTDGFNPVKEDDILICVRNGSKRLIGKNTIINKENTGFAFGAFMTVFRGKFNRFLFQWFDTVEYKKEVYKNLGATINSINGSELKKFKVPFPTLVEQQKIAKFLNAIDSRISTQSEIIKHQESLKKGLMQQLFSQQLRFKDNNGADFPDWEEKRLGEVCDIVGGGTPNTNESKYWNGEIDWYTPTEIKTKYLKYSNRKITELGLKNSSAKILPKDSLLFTSRATIGVIGILEKEASTNQGFQSFIPNSTFNIEFLYYWIINHRKEFIRKCSGSTFIEISKSEIIKILIYLPNLKEQTKIANFLSSIDERLEKEKQILEAYKQQKKYLLQNMFV